MNAIHSRINRLMERLELESGQKITVTFSDGSVRKLDAGECIGLVMDNTANICRFDGGKEHGLLPDLLNGLLEA